MQKLPVSEKLLRECIIDAGKLMLTYYNRDIKVSQKKDLSPLTEADSSVNTFLQEKLRGFFPDAGWLSEESKDSDERQKKEWVWVVDPLDGTKEFVKRIPEFTISIALIHNGAPIIGSVYNPSTGEGAVGNVLDKSIESWGKKDFFHDLIVSRTEFDKPKMTFLRSSGLAIEPIGSVAYKLLLAAIGNANLTFSLEPKSEWDLCGGVALLQAAGYEFIKFDGSPVLFNNPDPLITSWTLGGKKERIAEVQAIIKSNENHLRII